MRRIEKWNLIFSISERWMDVSKPFVQLLGDHEKEIAEKKKTYKS